MKAMMILIGWLAMMWFLNGCSMLEILAADDSNVKAQAICTQADPMIRGQSLGPIAVVSAKAAADFVGGISVKGDSCDVVIDSAK